MVQKKPSGGGGRVIFRRRGGGSGVCCSQTAERPLCCSREIWFHSVSSGVFRCHLRSCGNFGKGKHVGGMVGRVGLSTDGGTPVVLFAGNLEGGVHALRCHLRFCGNVGKGKLVGGMVGRFGPAAPTTHWGAPEELSGFESDARPMPFMSEENEHFLFV